MTLTTDNRLQVNYTTTIVQKYQLKVDNRMTNLFTLSLNDLSEILKDLNKIYRAIENSESKPAGYEVHFCVIAPEKRPIEVILEAHGTRGNDEEMKMPRMPEKPENCAFCKNTNFMDGYEDATTNDCYVMKSLEGNPLVISRQHSAHFFEMSSDPEKNLLQQQDLLETAIKTMKIYKEREGKNCSRYRISSHIGVEGHQTFSHTHMHILTSLG